MGVTIGLPIYNEGKTLRRTLQSIVDNIESVDRVILYDNASTDETADVCKEFCNVYAPFEYHRQGRLVSALSNGISVLNMVEGKYYMQMGGMIS